jgi:hypothetical protein
MQDAADLVAAQHLSLALQLQGLGKVARYIMVETAIHAAIFHALHAEHPNQVLCVTAAAAAAARGATCILCSNSSSSL